MGVPAALLVDGSRGEFLSGAAFAADEDRGPARCGTVEELACLVDYTRFAEEALNAGGRRRGQRSRSTRNSDCFVEGMSDLFDGCSLIHDIEHAASEGVRDVRGPGVARKDDDGQPRPSLEQRLDGRDHLLDGTG